MEKDLRKKQAETDLKKRMPALEFAQLHRLNEKPVTIEETFKKLKAELMVQMKERLAENKNLPEMPSEAELWEKARAEVEAIYAQREHVDIR